MKYILLFVAGLAFFEFTNAYCCFRDPWMLSSTPCDTYAMTSPCTNMANYCGCDMSCKCFRNPANVCEYCIPRPVCQCGCGQCDLPYKCFNPANVCEYCIPRPVCQCGCGCMNMPIYFPEVEYPCSIIDINPFICSSCNCY